MKINEMNMVITGANGALASFLLEYFSTRAAFVVGTVRNLAETYKPKNNERIIEMDPLDHYSIDDAIGWINNEAGDIHVWMNIIGGFSMGTHVEEERDGLIYMYNTNFITALNCCQQILSHMKKNSWGRIINMGAKSALKGVPLAGPYCASKSAVHSLTKIIALESGGHITCNAILPGIINTPANRISMPKADYSTWIDLLSLSKKIKAVLCSQKSGLLIEI